MGPSLLCWEMGGEWCELLHGPAGDRILKFTSRSSALWTRYQEKALVTAKEFQLGGRGSPQSGLGANLPKVVQCFLTDVDAFRLRSDLNDLWRRKHG